VAQLEQRVERLMTLCERLREENRVLLRSRSH